MMVSQFFEYCSNIGALERIELVADENGDGHVWLRWFSRHCERSEAIHAAASGGMDCFVAALLAMTELIAESNNTRLPVVNASSIIEL